MFSGGRIKQLLCKAFPTIRIHGTTAAFSTLQPIKCSKSSHKINSGTQCLHFSSTSGDQSDQQEPPIFEISAKLPDVLQQQCQNWMRALWAEQKAKDANRKWCNCELKCTNVSTTTDNDNHTSELTMSMEGLTREAKRVFMRYIAPSSPVLLRPFVKCAWQEDIVGILRKHLFNPTRQLSASIVFVKRRFSQDEQEQIKETLFDVRLASEIINTNLLDWLKHNKEWLRMPGFPAMLYAFKCKPWPTSKEIGKDPTDWIGEEEKNSLDQSQLEALCAVQNLKRPIVAVHGPPGTGKTMLLARHLQELKRQGKSAFVLSSSLTALYNLINIYEQTTGDANYLILKRFNEQLADNIVADPNIRQNMEKRSIFGHKFDMKKERLVFATPSLAAINPFTRNRIIFDVLIVDEANGISECEMWSMALPLAPIVRLFGNFDGREKPLSSEEARELHLNKALLRRLYEEFGTEVNFHLKRQYRSAPAIQQWPARAFYHQRAAEPDKSVENIHLKDLLLTPDAKMITDPLVLVDLNRLEGEWQRSMFESEMGGDSYYNFGEALLVAAHLRKLFENMLQQKETSSQIAYITQYQAQRVRIRDLFQCFLQAQLRQLEKVRLDQFEMEGQSCEVLLQTFVTADRARKLLSGDPFHLKQLAFEMTRARRQYMLFARSEWLEEGSDQSRQLLQTFRSHGRIIGPNDMLKLKHHTQIFDTKVKINSMVHRKRIAEHRKKYPDQKRKR